MASIEEGQKQKPAVVLEGGSAGTGLIIYEVNLTLRLDMYEKNKTWLYDHFKAMVCINRFMGANIFHPINLDPTDDTEVRQKTITVQYRLESFAELEKYLGVRAKAMRNLVVDRLGQDYTATRRVFLLDESIPRS